MRWSRWPVRSHVVVNLRDGSAIAGVLVARRGPLLVLAMATLHQQGSAPVPVDGQVYVERPQVRFIQEPPPGGGGP